MIGFEIFLAIGMFTAIVLGLVAIILVARAKLVSSGDVTIQINGEHSLTVPAGGKLLQTLAANNVFLSSACGGGGTCAQCKCVVVEGGGEMLPTEESHFTRRQAKEGWRLSCQTPVKQDMQIRVPEEVFGVKKWECTVESNPNVATFIKELTLRLPAARAWTFVPAATCSWNARRTWSSTRTSISSRNIAATGTSSTCGATCRRSTRR